ncbi:MAG: HTTM domain-containing protein [Pirellulaceae bacterium]
MKALIAAVQNWGRHVAQAWDRFWFTPQAPHTLALIRILGGGMLLYTHLVWSLHLEAFLGPHGWLPRETVALLNQGLDGRIYAWSYLAWTDSPALLWTLHLAGLIVLAMLVAGAFTRITSVLAFIIAISYCHRLTGSLFGLDQINVFIAMYLMLGASGSVWSVDRWLARRRGDTSEPAPAVSSNLAIRLLQVHLCVIYLFGGIGKMRGELWWDGSAVWFALANLEYQSLNLTWLVHHAWAIALLTHATVFWETFYCFLVWPKLTRPVCLAMAVAVHAGIGLCLGMLTFGLVMIIANLAFVSPEMIRATVGWLLRPLRRLATRGTMPTELVGIVSTRG